MKIQIRQFFIFLLLLVSAGVTAQTVLRGTVTDSEDGSRIIGATVTEYDKDRRIIKGTITDPNGNYNLRVENPEDIIIISYIGYASAEFSILGREVINVELESSAILMEEVVITAESDFNSLTGVAQRDITGSQVRIDMSESKHLGVVSAEEALQGKISGLDIMTSGNPGGGSQIVIRGLGSLGGSTPLIVVDDIEQNITIDEGFDFGAADQEDIGDLVNISPQDIKSIDVLKDAASAAIWGSKGADGVLIIQTHRGKRGSTSFEYQGKYTINVQPPPVPMLNGDEYIMMQLEQLHNQLGLFEVPDEIAYDKDYVDFYNYNKNTDWVEAISQTGFINDQYFRISGGGDKARYFASVNYQTNDGTTVNTALNRLSTRINLDYNISSKIRFSVNFNYSNSAKEDNYEFRFDLNNNGIIDEDERKVNVRQMAYIKAPNMAIWEHDENGNLTGEYFTPVYSYQGDGDQYFNPVAVANLSSNDQNDNQVQNSFVMDYNVLTWLRFRQTISFQYLNRKRKHYLPIDAIGTDWLNDLVNRAWEQNYTTNKILSRSQLTFIPRLKNPAHSVSGMLLAEVEMQTTEFAALSTSRGPGGGITDPAADATMHWINSSSSENRGIGLRSSFNYKYKDRYLLSMIASVDGSSKFGSNHRWGLFPSVSLGWRFSEEEFLSGIEVLSDSKLRFSWGQTGKQPTSAYDRHAIFNTSDPNLYIENPIIIQEQIQLENLKWQTVSQMNLGLDLGFLNDRIILTGEIYRKITEDILWKNYKIPKTSGYTVLKYYNGGMLENKGWEFYTQVGIIRKDRLRWDVNFNIANNFNVFLEFPENFNNEVDINIGNGLYPRRADIGQPVGAFYGFRYLGVWPSDEDVVALDAYGNVLLDANKEPVPLTFNKQYRFVGGDAIYEDINHDGNIDLLDVVYLGDSNPDFIGGFGSTFTWRQFRASIQFHYRTGFQIVNEVAMDTEGMLDKNNQSKAVLSRWRIQGQDEEGMIPRAYMNHPANNLGSDRYVENGDFFRLNNLTFSYMLPRETCSRIGFKSLDFAITLRKIVTFTYYTGQDPEIPQTGDDPFWFGTDDARTPIPKSYVFSISAGF